MGADLATSFHNASDVCPLENDIIDAQLHHMAGTSHRLQVSWQVGGELQVEDAHLVARRVGDDELSDCCQVPVIQLLGEPVSDVARAVVLRERHAAKDQCLSTPVRGDVVCRLHRSMESLF